MRLLQKAASVYSTTSTRGVGELFIGANVKLRNELQTRQLEGVKVAVLHKNSKALLISKILQDHGAEITHFSVKGEASPSFLNIRELDLSCTQGKSYLENVLRKSDVFLDGVGCEYLEGAGLRKTEIARRNAQLIVASVDDKDAFAAMNTMKSIAIGLYLREKHTAGQVMEMGDSSKYLASLQSYAKETK